MRHVLVTFWALISQVVFSFPLAAKPQQDADRAKMPVALRQYFGQDFLIVVVRSLDCDHCAEQLNELEEIVKSAEAWPKTIVVTGDTEKVVSSMRAKLWSHLKIIPDPNDLILHFICSNPAGRLHAIAILNKNGAIVWGDVSRYPYVEFKKLIQTQVKINLSDGSG